MKGHANDYLAQRFEPHHWRDPSLNGRTYPNCSYCGSICPEDLALALGQQGERLEEADRKYGWPHKFYVVAPGLHAKFYTTHLQDADPGDRSVIERAMGLRFTFVGDRVSWRAFVEMEDGA